MTKNLIFIVNTGKFFFSHRSEILKKSLEKNYNVKIICGPPYGRKDLNYKILKIPFSRNKLISFFDLFSFIKIMFILVFSKNSIIHCITIKPIFWVGIINSILRLNHNLIFSFSGFGLLYDRKKFSPWKYYLISKIFKILFFGKKHPFSIFQNEFDKNSVCSIVKSVNLNNKIIKGSGTNINKFYLTKMPKESLFLFASRLLISKGVRDFIELAKEINESKNAKYKKCYNHHR